MREGITPPKFVDKFFWADFDAIPMPVLSLYPPPTLLKLEEVRLDVCGLEDQPRLISWSILNDLPRVKLNVPLICQIFNWSEEVKWEGIRLVDLLDFLRVDTHPEGYFAFYSRDRVFFEGLSRDEARDSRVLLATHLNGAPLPEVHGGPLRLVVPFLQGYKSVKWLGAIRAFRNDPVGSKRLLGQSPGGQLNEKWREKYHITPPKGRSGDPPPMTAANPETISATPSPDLLQPVAGDLDSGTNSEGVETPNTVLKEVIAILRPNKHQITRQALEAAGITSYTTYTVLGRSHQRGLKFQSDKKEGVAIKFLPKQFFSIVIPETLLSAAIAVIMKANRTGEGTVGDGRIFVCDIEDAVRISTDERGREAI
ncbi:MAG: molybdopterin-dependent oxidoreductase [Nitrospiria bacterium]